MKHYLLATIGFALLSVLPPASAAPAPVKKAAPLAALSLALPDSSNASVTETPAFDVRLTNLSPHTLWLRWVPPYPVVFQVEFKPALDTPSWDTGWTPLTPIPLPPEPAPDTSGTITVTEEHVERIEFLAGQQRTLLSDSTGFSLSKEGFYRISATLSLGATWKPTTRNLYRFDTPAHSAARSYGDPLVFHAAPLIVQRTARGFFVVLNASQSTNPGKTP